MPPPVMNTTPQGVCYSDEPTLKLLSTQRPRFTLDPLSAVNSVDLDLDSWLWQSTFLVLKICALTTYPPPNF